MCNFEVTIIGIAMLKTEIAASICPLLFFCILFSFSHINLKQGGGPSWLIPLGRRDSLTANQGLANQNLPAPFFSLDQLKAAFLVQGLNTTDLVTLSGIAYNHFHTYQQFNKKASKSPSSAGKMTKLLGQML